MRKVTAFMLSIVITATSAIAASYNIFDDDRPINYVELPANGHTEGEVVVENKVNATCTEGGSGDAVIYCTVCEEEL